MYTPIFLDQRNDPDAHINTAPPKKTHNQKEENKQILMFMSMFIS